MAVFTSRHIMAAMPLGLSLICATPAAAEPISAEEAQRIREEIRLLKAQLARLESRLGPEEEAAPTATSAPAAAPAPPQASTAVAAAAPPPPAKAAPETGISWKGSPQFTSDDRAFKVKGRIQADAGYVSHPPGSDDKGFGFTSEMRRIRLGGEGKLGSGFGYKLELELSDNKVDLVDTFVTYETKDWLVAIGNQNQFQSLDELTGDTTGSVMERAAFTDAFGFERRLGISAQYHHKDWLLQGGIFTDDIGALSNSSDGPSGGDENNSFGVDGRVVFAPKVDDTQLHFGASGHWRTLKRLADKPTVYRQRPFLHGTNSYVLETPGLNVDDEVNYGLEAAAIRGPWHAVAEAHWLRAVRPDAPDVGFFGGYAEVGYFLTKGDTRSYRNGIFGGADPKRPFGKGGIGAVQLNLRYDYLSLNDRSAGVLGGRQNAYLAGLVWTPINYLRFNLNYGYLTYSPGVAADGVFDDYNLHVIGTRIELDF